MHPQVSTDLLPSLHSTQQLLHLIAHRNHNQHRAQRWWKWFNLLRRGVRGVVDGLERRKVEEEGVGMTKAVFGGAKRGRKGKREEEDLAERWRKWLEERAGGCVVAFSSLISDPQFSPLGIVLFTILAEVCQKLKIELPPEATTAARMTANVDASLKSAEEAALATKARETKRDGQKEEDIGVPVDLATTDMGDQGGEMSAQRGEEEERASRTQEGRQRRRRRQQQQQQGDTSPPPATIPSTKRKPVKAVKSNKGTAPRTKRKKPQSYPGSSQENNIANEGERIDEDETQPAFSAGVVVGRLRPRPGEEERDTRPSKSRSEEESMARDEEKREATKKRKRKKGNAIDDLFSGLI